MDTPTNVLLITVDTLRADHLGCYGYARETSPHIDALARQGTLAERFFCAGIPTQPSYTTLYTGQHPITHGVVAHGGRFELAKDAPFLPQIFLRDGYTTCAVDNLARVKAWFGRGYEFYIDPSVRRPLLIGVTCEELNGRLIPWLQRHHDEPFFALVHYWDPHAPLVPPAQYRHLFYEGNPTDPANRSLERWWEHPLGALARDTWLRRPDGHVTDAAYVEALYDQEVRHLDDGIGEVLATLDQLGLADDTLVLLFGDHGESFTEHGIFFEHHGLYDCTLRVPFIARWPGRIPAGRRLPQLLQHQDIAPTLLEAAGIPVPEEMDGCSFWPLLSGEAEDAGRDRIYSCESTWQAKWCVRTRTHKLIVARAPDRYGNPDRELYDLEADPGETQNLAEAQPGLVAALERDLEDWIAGRLSALGRDEDPVRAHGVSIRGV
jgi:arylsulfatase A-like enzyme